MSIIYLDYNCFQRGFDDPRQFRIRMEALACQEIFANAENGKLEWPGRLCTKMKRICVLYRSAKKPSGDWHRSAKYGLDRTKKFVH